MAFRDAQLHLSHFGVLLSVAENLSLDTGWLSVVRQVKILMCATVLWCCTILHKRNMLIVPLPFSRTRFHQHPVENLHHFRRLLLRYDLPHLLHISRDQFQDPRGNRHSIRRQHPSLEEQPSQEPLQRES
jgi:hypothetical protein